VAGARTTATVVVLVIALWTLVVLARPLTRGKTALLPGMAGLAALAVALPGFREDVLLLQPSGPPMLLAAGLGVVGALLVEVVMRTAVAQGGPARPPGRPIGPRAAVPRRR
jgi:cation-transporting P-type ATPase E